MNPWLRRLLVFSAIVAVSLLVAISRLPSPREIGRKFREVSAPASAPPVPTPSGWVSLAIASPTPTPTLGDAPRPDGAKAAAERARERNMILALVAEDPRDTRVCEQLGQTRSKPLEKNRNLTADDIFGPDRTDSLMEAYRMPLRAIFQEPVVAELIQEVDGYGEAIDEKTEAEREGFLSKVGFYARLARMTGTLIANKEKFERLGDRASNLAVLAKLALLSPALRDDSSVVDLCRRIQSAETEPTLESIRAERREISALLSAKGIKPEDVEYNPESFTKLSIKREKNNLTIGLTDNPAAP